MRNKTQNLPFILVLLLLIPCWGIAWKPGGDLGVYYRASTWLLQGWVSKLYSENAEIGNFFYGPFGLSLLKPLALLSFDKANLLWLILQTMAYLFFWRNLFFIFPELLQPEKLRLFLLVWLVSIKPIHASFQSHNVQLIFAALLSWVEISRFSEKNFLQAAAGSVVTLLTSIKIYPAFLTIYYLIRGSGGVRLGLFFGGLVSILVPMVVFGFSAGLSLPFQFVENAVKYHQVYDLAKDVVSLSLPSLLATWLPKNWVAGGAIGLTTLLISTLFFLWVYLSSRKLKPKDNRHLWAFGWSMMGLLNSTTRPDYFIYFVPAFASLPILTSHSIGKNRYRLGITISVLLIAFITEWTLGSRELTHYLEGLRVPVLGVLLLCLMQFLALRNILRT